LGDRSAAQRCRCASAERSGHPATGDRLILADFDPCSSRPTRTHRLPRPRGGRAAPAGRRPAGRPLTLVPSSSEPAEAGSDARIRIAGPVPAPRANAPSAGAVSGLPRSGRLGARGVGKGMIASQAGRSVGRDAFGAAGRTGGAPSLRAWAWGASAAWGLRRQVLLVVALAQGSPARSSGGGQRALVNILTMATPLRPGNRRCCVATGQDIGPLPGADRRGSEPSLWRPGSPTRPAPAPARPTPCLARRVVRQGGVARRLDRRQTAAAAAAAAVVVVAAAAGSRSLAGPGVGDEAPAADAGSAQSRCCSLGMALSRGPGDERASVWRSVRTRLWRRPCGSAVPSRRVHPARPRSLLPPSIRQPTARTRMMRRIRLRAPPHPPPLLPSHPHPHPAVPG
jgi:hypothetical protein